MAAGKNNPAYKHGHTTGKFSATYHSWASMIQRCTNPKRFYYHRYGGRGITVCKRWAKFENFLKDMGERPEGTTLDRKNNDGNYTPANCRWATKEQQASNKVFACTKHKNKILKLCKAPKTTAQLAKALSLHPEPTKKFIRELRADGLVSTRLVKVGKQGRTLEVKTTT
jgi:hypothetical protein